MLKTARNRVFEIHVYKLYNYETTPLLQKNFRVKKTYVSMIDLSGFLETVHVAFLLFR